MHIENKHLKNINIYLNFKEMKNLLISTRYPVLSSKKLNGKLFFLLD